MARQSVNRISLSEDAADHGQQIREVKVETKVAGNWQQIAPDVPSVSTASGALTPP
ncbi:hypothetical protein H5392_07830 [Tessaracoccus sp. MC1865]|uniref:hypothetical protein n=1 Tax=Tessaracoccus sp. MC1865 TaxID=2760310 RepID=UPI0016042816|nr:hypothetical protein [Tessaracoccus sp. MC1865]MBB1483770.1 hypothetical protein [Tessaracoccus sp. MC1865]QTO36839.1 hypothetical protein J7D54_10200 [Tessaracoccus sp. MC1865]